MGIGIYPRFWRNEMATEFKTALDHGTYILNALVKADSKTVELFLVGEREDGETIILEGAGVSFYSFDMSSPTDSVDVFRKEYMKWLEKGGKEKLENALNPISAFNAEPEEPKKKPVAKKAPAKKPVAKAKPKPKK
jgi:hypothetical protein